MRMGGGRSEGAKVNVKAGEESGFGKRKRINSQRLCVSAVRKGLVLQRLEFSKTEPSVGPRSAAAMAPRDRGPTESSGLGRPLLIKAAATSIGSGLPSLKFRPRGTGALPNRVATAKTFSKPGPNRLNYHHCRLVQW